MAGWKFLDSKAAACVIILATVCLIVAVVCFWPKLAELWQVAADRRKERREREKARQAARQAARPPVSRSGVGSQPPPVPVRVPVQARRVRVHPRPVPKALLPYEADLSDIDVDAIVREYRGEHR
jgi:hypothetical protein